MYKKSAGISALIIALGLILPPASAMAEAVFTAPVLTITGNATTTYHWFRNSPAARNDKYGYGTLFATEDSGINFQATGRMNVWDESFYDWFLRFNGNAGARGSNVDSNRLRVKSRIGTVLFGVHRGVEDMMARGAYAVMGATGGFDGNMKATMARPVGLYYSTDMVGATKDATKITLLTPRFYGFQFGYSFTPNTQQKGEGTDDAPFNYSVKNPKEPFDLSSSAFGLNYINNFENGLAMAFSVTAVVAHTKSPAKGGYTTTNLLTIDQTAPRHNTASYAIGGVVVYQNFELGVEWINNGKSRQIKNPNLYVTDGGYTGAIGKFNAGQAWSAAAAYVFGPNKVAYGYYHSQRKFNGENVKADTHSVTFDRAIIPGFSLFAEGVIYDLDTNQNAIDLKTQMAASNSSSTTFPGEGASNHGRTLLMGAMFRF